MKNKFFTNTIWVCPECKHENGTEFWACENCHWQIDEPTHKKYLKVEEKRSILQLED